MCAAALLREPPRQGPERCSGTSHSRFANKYMTSGEKRRKSGPNRERPSLCSRRLHFILPPRRQELPLGARSSPNIIAHRGISKLNQLPPHTSLCRPHICHLTPPDTESPLIPLLLPTAGGWVCGSLQSRGSGSDLQI